MNPNLFIIRPSQHIRINLMYAGTRNMFGRNFYHEIGLSECYAHVDMQPHLQHLEQLLAAEGLCLEIRDCYRPLSVQAEMWNYLPDERYIAPPARGSKHNKGVAVDCTLCDAAGKELRFPTEVDGYREDLITDFLNGNMTPVLAHLQKASHSWQSPTAVVEISNRHKLKSLMEEAGFEALEEEWWHYELPRSATYPLISDF